MLLPDRKELDRTLLSRDVETRLEHLQVVGALRVWFPEVQAMVGFGGGDSGHKDLWSHTKRVVHQTKGRSLLRWAALFHDVGKVRCFQRDAQGKVSFHHHEAVSAKLFERAALRNSLFEEQELREIKLLIYNLGLIEAYEDDWTDSAVRRLYKHTKEHFLDLLALSRADITTASMAKRAGHLRRIKTLRDRALSLAEQDAIPAPLIKGLGDALCLEFGLTPSPALGALMQKLREAVEAGDLVRQAPIQDVIRFAREKTLA